MGVYLIIILWIPNPFLSLAILSGIKSKSIHFNRSKVEGLLPMWGWSSHHVFFFPSGQFCSKRHRHRERERDLGFIYELCLASRKTLDYLWKKFFLFCSNQKSWPLFLLLKISYFEFFFLLLLLVFSFFFGAPPHPKNVGLCWPFL